MKWNTETANRSPVHVYAFGLCYASVCAPARLTIDEVVAGADAEHPTGLDHGWSLASEPFKDGSPNPHVCEEDPSRRHYLLSC